MVRLNVESDHRTNPCWLTFSMIDSGPGFPKEALPKLFERFSQAGFRVRSGGGTGLGLSMAYGIVKQTGGWILCDSVVGKGTTFRILLPRHIPTVVSEPAQIEAVKAPAADLTGRGTILLVEDEEAVRAFGARALSSRGYTVLEAASGREALDVVEAENGAIDLIVSDVVMPEMDGPTMFGELRKRGIKCKVIFVSGYAEDAFQKNLPAGEDFGFLPKPFTLKQLVEAVKGNLS
jgi:two-component system cell cycle sensor histidine kinase/response regulator CckA